MATRERPFLFGRGYVHITGRGAGGIRLPPPPTQPPPGGQGKGGGQGQGQAHGKGQGVGGGRGTGKGQGVGVNALAVALGTISSTAGVVVPSPDVGAVTRIGQVVADGTSSTIDFTGIAGTYSSLRLIVWGRSDLAAVSDNVYVRFNADSGANYDWQWSRVNSSAITVNFNPGDTAGINVAIMTAATGTANLATSFTVDIPSYAATSFFHTLTATAQEQHGITAATSNLMVLGGTWHSTAAITRVTVRLASAHFVSGSIATLYGLL